MPHWKLFPTTIAVALLSLMCSASANAQSAFYKDKTITIVQGRAPGGQGDIRVRALLPILQKNIPGNPAIISEYMDGGGGRKAANHMFRVARADGLTIANIGEGFVSSAVLGESGVQYDVDKFIYLGAGSSQTNYVFYTRSPTRLEQLSKNCARQPASRSAARPWATAYIFSGDCSLG